MNTLILYYWPYLKIACFAIAGFLALALCLDQFRNPIPLHQQVELDIPKINGTRLMWSLIWFTVFALCLAYEAGALADLMVR